MDRLLPSNDDFDLGVLVGAQRNQEAQDFAVAQQDQQTAVVEELHKLNERLRPRNPLLKAIGALSIAYLGATAGFAIWNKVHHITPRAVAQKELLGIQNDFSIPFDTMQKLVSGYAEHDAEGYMPNPWAYGLGIVERVIQYSPNGALKLEAVDDPDIGFYILMSELRGDGTYPLEFTFDTPGDGERDPTATIRISTPEPEVCQIDVDTAGSMVPDPGCTPLDDPETSGLLSMNAWDGAPGFEDNGILTDGWKSLYIAINNAFCELNKFGTSDLEAMIARQYSGVTGITPQMIKQGVTDYTMTALRMIFAKEYNLPYTNAQGRPIFLRDDDLSVLRQMAIEAGKPLDELTPEEYHALAFQYDTMARFGSDAGIDPGPTYGREIVQASDENSDIRLPGKTMNEENADTLGWNYTCLPDAGTEAAESMMQQDVQVEKFGNLYGLMPNALMSDEGLVYDGGEEAVARLDEFLAGVGL